MKTNLDIFKADKNLEQNGVWFEINDTTGFLVRRMGPNNPKIKAAMAKYFKPHARQIEMGTMDEAKGREIMAKIFVEACLVDWKGVEIDGKEVDYSPEVAINLLLETPDLHAALDKYANDFNSYRIDLGNS